MPARRTSPRFRFARWPAPPTASRERAGISPRTRSRLRVARSSSSTTTMTRARRSARCARRASRAPDGGPRARWDIPAAAISLAGREIIVIDDDDDARETLGALLKARGASVRTFDRGRHALEQLRLRSADNWPDLMICDIGLP